jgi:uncharacterized membrane protein
MESSYNRIAGQSAERLAALSDGIFAVAMTLLVLDLRLPAADAIHGEHQLWRAILAMSPRILMYYDELSHPGHLLGGPADAA